jgi:hypothetical protein
VVESANVADESQARFVFLGTVLRIGAATELAIPVDTKTAVVRVDEVLLAPQQLQDEEGQEVTVRLRDAPLLQPDQQAIFYTNPWLYGEHLAVIEVDRRGSQQRAGVSRQLQNNSEREEDRLLTLRIADAELIVVGVVVDTKPVFQQQPTASEHDPEWWQAETTVEQPLKGAHPGPTVTFLFAASIDVAWFQAPKVRAGQSGIWLLQRPVEMLGIDDYVIYDPLDAQPRDQLDRIQRLLGGGGRTR